LARPENHFSGAAREARHDAFELFALIRLNTRCPHAPPRGIVEPLLAGEMSVDYIQAMLKINLTDDENAAVTAAIRRTIEHDRFPHAPRLDPQRAAPGKFEAGAEPEPSKAVKAAKRMRRLVP
jgi:hypothetical protein